MRFDADPLASFVGVIEAMVNRPDLVDFLHWICVRSTVLLDIAAAGVMLADEDDQLRVIAASNEETRFLEIFTIQHKEGVCFDVFQTGEAEQVSLAASAERWPKFATVARAHGYRWVAGLPLRYNGEILGTMNLFRGEEKPLSQEDFRVAQALTDVTTLALLQRRETAQARKHAKELQFALDSRVLIDQAKGMLAERLHITPDEAFNLLRRRARDSNRKLRAVADEVVNRDGTTRFSAG
jgi:GAF domain-containing protein